MTKCIFSDGPFFYLLLAGVAAILISFFELLYYVLDTSRHRPGHSICSVFKEEVGNAVHCSAAASSPTLVRQHNVDQGISAVNSPSIGPGSGFRYAPAGNGSINGSPFKGTGAGSYARALLNRNRNNNSGGSAGGGGSSGSGGDIEEDVDANSQL